MNNNIFKKHFWLIAVVICSMLVSMPLFLKDCIVNGHDSVFHLVRIEGLKESIEGGQFPVQISGYAFNGYGEASGAFYPNLFFYIPVLMRFCGLSLAVSYNAFCVLINVLTGLLTYWSFTKLLNSKRQGATAAMIYIGFLYRLIDIYSRSAIGETIAMAFVPLTLISIWLTLNHSVKYWSVVVIGFTGLLQSHVISTLIIIVVAIVMMFRYYRSCIQNVKTIGKIVIFTTLLNIWFFVPFVSLYTKIDFAMKDIGISIDILSEYVLVPESAITIQAFCGFLMMFIIFIFVAIWLFDKIKHRKPHFDINWFFAFMLIFGILITISMFTPSFWQLIEAIPYLGDKTRVIQFPTRFMILAAFAFSYCAGIVLVQIDRFFNNRRSFIVNICILITLTNVLYLIITPNLNTTRSSNSGRLSTVTNWNINIAKIDEQWLKTVTFVHHVIDDYIYSDIISDIEISDVVYDNIDNSWHISKYIKMPKDDVQIAALDSSYLTFIPPPCPIISDFKKIGMKITFIARTDEPLKIKLPMFYYPGYAAYTSEGEELPLSDSGDVHRMQVEVPAGETHVTVKYVGETLWRICDLISLFSLFVFLYIMFIEKKLSGE